MSSSGPVKEILQVANRKELKETGGGHNQKGVNFQRYWAVMRMFELEQNGATDFLLLFESIQDIAELDSSSDDPSSIRIYQIKKRDRKEWSWAELTRLPIPRSKTGQIKIIPKTVAFNQVKDSLIGKLYASIIAFRNLESEGHFISNSGCCLPLSDGTNAATSVPCSLASLSQEYLALLRSGLETIHEFGMPPPDLKRLHISRVVLPPDDPRTHLIGLVSIFLNTRSPRHANQAEALVDSLVTKISPLGAKTDACKTFHEMRQQRGFSRDEFTNALANLEEVPDLLTYLDPLLTQLSGEGMDYRDIIGIRAAVTGIQRRQLLRAVSRDDEALIQNCDSWLVNNPLSDQLLPYFNQAYNEIRSKHPSVKRVELLAQLALRAIKKCVDQT